MPSAQTLLPNTKISWLRRIFAGNGLLWALYFVLVLVSLYTVSSALSSELYKSVSVGGLNPILKHAAMLLIGVFAAVMMSVLSGRAYRYALPRVSTLIMLVLFVAQFVLGQSTNGAERWINLGFITIQPAEFLRVYVVIWGAFVAGKDREEDPRKEFNYWMYWGRIFILSIMVLLSNLSTFLIIFAFLYLYSWVLKAPKRFMYRVTAIGAIAMVLGGAYLYLAPESMLPGRAVTWHNRLHGAVKEREDRFAITDENRQEQMGRMAIANSKLVGRGPGNSKMRDSLSQAYSDYLYAIIIEEYGILGLLFIPSLYLVWMLIGYREARKQTNVFRSNLIKGFGILYPLQALVNMIVASGIITTGQTLPLISYGGSSILATSMAFGIMIGASRVDKPKREPHTEEAEFTEVTATEEVVEEPLPDTDTQDYV